MHYQNTYYMCKQLTRVEYSVVIARNLIHLFHNSTVCVMNSRVSGQCLYTIYYGYFFCLFHNIVLQINEIYGLETKKTLKTKLLPVT